MAFGELMISVKVRKMINSTIRTSTKPVVNHPFIVGTLLFVVFLYRSSPFLFSLLVSVSPVLVCTAVLLGTLLTFGDPQIPQIENLRTEVSSSLSSIPLQNNSTVIQERSVVFSKDDLKTREVSVDDGDVDDHFESSSMQWIRMNNEEEEDEHSDSGSNGDKSSSAEPSMTDIIPLLDEIDPLIEGENSGLSIVDSDEEIDHKEAEDEDEDEDNAELINNDEVLNSEEITWTEDDQKNLMDLGSSELERNQRLESLIARRIARRSMKMSKERNLIDLDGFDLPTISTTRQNPFDFPNITFDDIGLPPIPGSAPSILVPRRNPFDIPYDSSEEKPDLTGDGFPQEFMELSHKEPVFRRHESFHIGSSSSSIFEYSRKDGVDANRGSRFRPYFVAERLEGTSYPSFLRQSSEVSESSCSYQRQSSDVSESKASSIAGVEETIPNSDVINDEYESRDLDLHLPEIRLGEEVEEMHDSSSHLSLSSEEYDVIENNGDEAEKLFETLDFDNDTNVLILERIEEEHISSSSSSIVSEVENNTESLEHDEAIVIIDHIRSDVDNDFDVPIEQDPVYDSSPRASKINLFISSEDILDEFTDAKQDDGETDHGVHQEVGKSSEEPKLVNEDGFSSEQTGSYPENVVDVSRIVEDKLISVADDANPVNEAKSALDISFISTSVLETAEANTNELTDSRVLESKAGADSAEVVEIYGTGESHRIQVKVLIEETKVGSIQDSKSPIISDEHENLDKDDSILEEIERSGVAEELTLT